MATGSQDLNLLRIQELLLRDLSTLLLMQVLQLRLFSIITPKSLILLDSESGSPERRESHC